MATLGVIGSGNIGSAVARLAVEAGIEVVMANSRGPESLADKVRELGVRAGTVEEAIQAGDWVMVTIPLGRYVDLPVEPFAGKVVLDTMNYYPSRDGRIEQLDREELTTAQLVQERFSAAHTVKVFNNISFRGIVPLARPAGAADRTALPISGDDADAKTSVTKLMDALGFDVVDVGTLADSWRYEPETDVYVTPYLASTSTPEQRAGGQVDQPKSLSAAELTELLAKSHRPPVGDRRF
ncbi:NAD(P)-binding domain-containing protein [Kribbella sp. NPDC026611]|uniref:NADPH-dependent F420 reductase n=1 Tax=Kribbella sp. NPDC026611 TaxID=3154911 RepID=UPI0033C23A5B